MADTLKPSDLAVLTEDQIGIALANIRAVIKNAEGEALAQLQEQRRELNKRLDKFVFLALDRIDKDPEIRATIDELKDLTLKAQKAAKTMKTVKSSIDGAVKILEFADRILGILA